MNGEYTSVFDLQITTFILVRRYALASSYWPPLILISILYLIISYFTQFSPLLSELTPSEYHSVLFVNSPTSSLWDSSEIVYSLLRITNIIQTNTSTEIYLIISAFSDVWNFTDPIEEISHHQFFLIQYWSR